MLRAALDSYARLTAREFEHDRTQTVGASEIGKCERQTFWFKNEADPVHKVPRDSDYADNWGARTRGSVYETHWWAPALLAHYGGKLLLAGDKQQTFVSGFLSATPDGLLIDQPRDLLKEFGIDDIESDCILIECKTIDPRARLSDKPKPEHEYQTQAQLGLVRMQTPYKPMYSLVSYTDASFWDEIREYPVRFDPEVFETAERRAMDIMTADDFSELKPEGWIAGGDECKYCPFLRPCGLARTAVPGYEEPIDPQFAAEIVDLARQAKSLSDLVEGDEKALRIVQNEIRERLRSRSRRRVEWFDGVEKVKVLWSPVKGRESWDNKAIREAAAERGVDLAAFRTEGDPTDRLVITITKGG